MAMAFKKIRGYFHALFFENRNIRQTAMKNAFWLGASTVAGRVIRAGLVIYVARALGTAGYGIYSYALGISGFFSILSDIGINGIMIREGARNKSAVPFYIATSIVIKGFLIFFCAALIFTVVPFMTGIKEAVALLPLAAILLAADSLRDFTSSIIRADEKMETEAGINIFTNLAITILGIAAIFIRRTPGFLMFSYTLGSVLGTVWAYWTIRRHFVHPFHYFRRSLVWPILSEAFPFALMGLMGTLMLSSDTIMLGWMTGATALGLYSAAQRPIQILYIIPGMLSGALFPIFSRLAVERGERFRHVFEKVMTISLMFALPLVLGGLVLGQGIILLLFGQEYAGGALSFLILLTTILINFPTGLIGDALFAHNQKKNFIGYLILGAGGNILLNFLLIPRWGIVGSSIGTVISQFMATGFMWYKLKSIQYFRILPHLKKALVASLGMALGIYILREAGSPVILNIALGAAIYAGLLVFLREPLLNYFSLKDLLRQPSPGTPVELESSL